MNKTISKLLKGFAHFWKDLVLLVLGIYLALWTENKVEQWNNHQKQLDYLYQLEQDLLVDQTHIKELIGALEAKEQALRDAIQFFIQQDSSLATRDAEEMAVQTAGVVNNYHFFTPQDFTFISMRESGDFKLITNEQVKRDLLKLNRRYALQKTLQQNYLQGLDDEFIPMWVRHADMIENKLIDPSILTQPIFKNMLGFAWNETAVRLRNLHSAQQEIAEMIEALRATQNADD
ncbi:hypothetical protein QTP81_07195 [Alteromonas sp. ASW11-36]|uniref:Uncharacterized protein n=1 Tax=Alteromonas arenosi TaxID=3055817 RepID=A0ABT7SW04_9ALTE|nr:hypothetical protein [Alteromonas sp. ASW11-36]MDM7860377.1 hypothetical protein [Alteromonas sp. ASW11-36]